MKAINFLLLILSFIVSPVFSANLVISVDSSTTNGGFFPDGSDVITLNSNVSLTPASGNNGFTLDAGNTANIYGDVSILGNSTYGAFAIGSVTVNLFDTGTITSISGRTSGHYSHAIFVAADSNIYNYGQIITEGNGSQGIQVGDDSIVVNSGTISTYGSLADGITMNNGATITNSGTINLYGDTSVGIDIDDTGTTVTNSGTISTSGAASHAIKIDGNSSSDSNTVSSSGTIVTTGDASHGVYIDTTGSHSLTVSGSISTSGENSYGVYVLGDSNTLNISGTISVSGTNNNGIYLYDADSNSTTMSGDITVADGYGLVIQESDSNTTDISGDITSIEGDWSLGAYFINSDSNILTVGNITVAGTSAARGIELNNSDSNTININGKVSANAGDDAAIFVNSTSSNNTFTLNQGSVIDGRLYNNGSNNTLKLNLGAGRSYALETTGSSNWTIEDLNNRPMVTGSAYGIGVGNIETQGHEMYQRTYQVNQTLQQRQLANYKGNASPYWINSYYNKSSRSGSSNLSSNNLQFSNHRSGINLGYRVTKYEQPFEVLFNYENSSMNHDDFNHQISSDSMMAGVFIPKIKQLAGGDLSVNAMLGISDFRGNRKVMTNSSGYSGMRTIGSDYQAKHYVVGVGWLKELHQGEMLQTYVNIGADINHQQMESYREEAYYKFNSRDISQLQSRITLSADAQPFKNKLNINVNLGIENRNMIAGTQQGLYLNNTKTGYSHVNQTNTYLTSSLNISYPFTNTISAYAGYQYFDSGDDIKMSSGQIGVSGSF